jgi:HK97 family phage portal protein
VYACVRYITQTIGQLSFHVYAYTDNDGRRLDLAHPADRLIHTQPNPEMSAMTFWEALLGHALIWGNGYAEIERNQFSGKPIALWLLAPDRVEVDRTDAGKLVYTHYDQEGKPTYLASESVFHLRGLSFNGIVGYSPVRLMREAISLGLAAEAFGSNFFGRAVRPSGYIKSPGWLKDKAYDRAITALRNEGGIDNQLHPLILENGMEWVTIGVPPEDAQFLESRQFQGLEICRAFGVPPSVVFDMKESAVRANIEQEKISAITDGCVPWIVRLEQEGNAKLLGASRRGRGFCKMNVMALLRGETKARYEGYEIAQRVGMLNVDEMRAFEDMNPIGGEHGTTYVLSANYMTMEALIKKGETPAEPEPVAEAETVTKEPAGEPDSNGQNDGADVVAKLGAGQRGLVRKAFRRCLRVEQKEIESAAKRCAGSGDRFEGWLRPFCQKRHKAVLAEGVAAIDSTLEAVGGGERRGWATDPVPCYADQMFDEVAPAFGAGALPAILERRLREIPDQLTQTVLGVAKDVAMLAIMEAQHAKNHAADN